MSQHNELGKKGEELAISFLESQGYKIKEKNWRFKKAEIDIICEMNDILTFIEVKTRSTTYFGDPSEFVGPKKQALILDAANEYMKSIGYEWEIRFDIIGVVIEKSGKESVRHFKDAFFPDWSS